MADTCIPSSSLSYLMTMESTSDNRTFQWPTASDTKGQTCLPPFVPITADNIRKQNPAKSSFYGHISEQIQSLQLYQLASMSPKPPQPPAIDEVQRPKATIPNYRHPPSPQPVPKLSKQLLSDIRASATDIPLTYTPLQYIDALSLVTTTALCTPNRSSTSSSDAEQEPEREQERPVKATVYDKLTHLPLLIHRVRDVSKVLLVVNKPGRGARGWKPPSQVYTLTNEQSSLNSLGSRSVEEVFEMVLWQTLGLSTGRELSRREGTAEPGVEEKNKGNGKERKKFMERETQLVCRSLTPSIHRPCFGPLRLSKNQKVDGWILGVVYEFLSSPSSLNVYSPHPSSSNLYSPIPSMGVDPWGRKIQAEWPLWKLPTSSPAEHMRWWSWEEVRMSKEIDSVTKALVGDAFKKLWEWERFVEESLGDGLWP